MQAAAAILDPSVWVSFKHQVAPGRFPPTLRAGRLGWRRAGLAA
jgi:hypothetical protein